MGDFYDCFNEDETCLHFNWDIIGCCFFSCALFYCNSSFIGSMSIDTTFF